jgi:hypothetical protein
MRARVVDQGLGACSVGAFMDAQINEMLGVMLAVGHPA